MTAIDTERLILRLFDDADVDPLYEIQGDHLHMQYTFCAASREACRTWLTAYAKSREANGFAPWTVVHRLDERVVGWGGLSIDPNAAGWGVEVTYFVHPSYAGRGYATEVVRAALAHGFGELGLARIGAFAKPDNHASIRVLEKCGFELVRYEPALVRNRYEVVRENWV